MSGRKVTIGEGLPEDREEQVEETPVEDVELPEEDDQEEEEEYDSTKMDPETELWDGGPNFGTINAWKEQHGDVFVTSVAPDKHYVWRTINRFEYRNIVKMTEQAVSTGQVTQAESNLNNEEAITELCVLYPKYNRAENVKEMAGVASVISQQVMEASAFQAVEVRQL